MAALNDLTGKTFGKLTVVRLDRISARRSYWLARCSCGGQAIWRGDHIQSRPNPACKECEFEVRSAAYQSHGACADYGMTRLYRIWGNMRSRCNNPKNKCYRYYGGKGIQICAGWENFVAFRDWAMSHGYNDTLTIERKNSSLNYCPENCEWITGEENSRRSHITRKAA